jgi:hypothetical protein
MTPNTPETHALLGYPADARLLIVNADDFGMCHAVDEAVMRACPASKTASAWSGCPRMYDRAGRAVQPLGPTAAGRTQEVRAGRLEFH